MTDVVRPGEFNRSGDLRSIANAIEPLYPMAADLLRGIARELEND